MNVFQWVVGVIGVGGIGKFLWDIITARSHSRKNNAESSVMLINSAAGFADGIAKRLDRTDARFDEFRKEQEAKNEVQAKRNRQQDLLLMAHSAWDHRMAQKLRELGVPMEEPPPLFLTEGT